MQDSSFIEQGVVGQPDGSTLNLNAARTFVAICETGSFQRAAERVHRSPSAVSLHVSKLEAHLGTSLLDRNARRVRLTEDGEVLLGLVRRLLAVNDEAIATFRAAEPAQTVRLAAPHDLGVSLVPQLLARLASTHPHVTVEVRLDTADNVKRFLAAGTVNVALFNDIDQPEVVATELFSQPLGWLMQNGGRAIDRQPLPLAVAGSGCAWRDAAIGALQERDVPFRVAYQSDTSAGQLAAIRADLAVAALPPVLSDHQITEVPGHYDLPVLANTRTYVADDGGDMGKVISVLAGRSTHPTRPGLS